MGICQVSLKEMHGQSIFGTIGEISHCRLHNEITFGKGIDAEEGRFSNVADLMSVPLFPLL